MNRWQFTVANRGGVRYKVTGTGDDEQEAFADVHRRLPAGFVPDRVISVAEIREH